MVEDGTVQIEKLEKRIKELNDKFSQTLLFLSFALVVLATLKEKAGSPALERIALWWSFSLFPILIGVLPIKELGGRKECWYCSVRYFKVVLLWIAVILIGTGAWYFFLAVYAGIFR